MTNKTPTIRRKAQRTQPAQAHTAPAGGAGSPVVAPQQVAPPSQAPIRYKGVRTVPPRAPNRPASGPPSSGMGGQSAPPSRIQRVLPDNPQAPMGGQQSFAPRPMTDNEQAGYYNPGGESSQYSGLAPQPMAYTRGSVAPYRMIVRRGDGVAVVLEQGQTISGETLRQAPEAGDWAAYFGGEPPDSPYTTGKIREAELARVQQDQYEQQFGLPAGDTSTWRGWLSQYIAGGASYGAVGGAISGGIAGTIAAGPVGGLIGAAGGAVLGGVLGDYGSQGGTYQASEYVAAALGLQEAKDKFDQSLFGALGVFAIPGQWTEQALGVGSQAISDPADTFANISAAIEAGKLYYETDPTAGLRPSGTTFVDTDLPDITGGAAALSEARRRIAGGENPEFVLAEMTGRYGAFGQLRDLVAQSVLDPTNLLTGAATNTALRVGARVAGATEVLDDVGRVVGYTGRGARLLEAAEAARPRTAGQLLSGAGNLKDTLEIYKNLKVLEPFREGFTGARDLNLFQRVLLGQDAVQLYRGEYKAPQWFELWRKTPAAMAQEQIVMASDLLQNHIMNRLTLDESFPVEADRIIQTMRRMGDSLPDGADPAQRAILSLEGRVLQRALTTGGDVSGDLLKAFRDNRAEATLVDDIARVLRMSADDVVKEGAQAVDSLLARYQQAGGQLPDGLNPKVIKAALTMFRDGEVPRTVAEYRAALMGQLAAQAGQWSVQAFGVKAPRFLERLANLNKGVQSAVLLGLNPGYGVNNVLNNEATLVARGIWGMRSVQDLAAEVQRRGLGSPVRAGEAALTGDLIGDARTAVNSLGDIMRSAGDDVVRQAVEGPDDLLGRAQQGVGKVGRMMPVTAFSGKAEQWYSSRALFTAQLQMYDQLWRRGVAFPALDDSLAGALREVDPRLPDMVHAAIERGANPAEVMREVFEPVSQVSAAAVIEDTARRAGMTPDAARDLLHATGLDQVVDQRLAALPENPTAADVRRTMNDLRIEAESHIAERIAEQAKIEYQAAAQFGGADTGILDGGAVLMLMDQNRGRQIDAYNAHARIRESIWEEYLRGVIDSDQFRDRLRDAGNQMYERGLFPLLQANIDGIADAFKRTGQGLPDEFTTLQRSILMLTKDFHEQKQALLKEFFDLPPKRRTAEAWTEVQRQIDGDYNNLTGHIAERQGLMDEYIAAAYESRFPGSGNPIREWRDMVRAHEAQYQEAVRIQFEQARQMTDPYARNASWREFDQTMTRYRAQWAEQERALRQAAVEQVPGRDALEAEARRLRGIKTRPVVQVQVEPAHKPGARPLDGITRQMIESAPRSKLPAPLSEAIAAEAKQMLDDLKNGEQPDKLYLPSELGGPPTVSGLPSTYPDWYGPLKRSHETVMTSIQKIIEDNGLDVDKGRGRIIARIKSLILDRLAKGDPLTGRPPEPEVLRWMGKPELDAMAAEAMWKNSGQEPFIRPFSTTGPALTPEQAETLTRNLQVIEARENMESGVKMARSYRVEMVDEGGTAEVVDIETGTAYEVRYDQPDGELMLPPGMLASDGGLPMPIGSAQSEMFEQARPLLQSLQESAVDHVQGGKLRGAAEASPDLQERLRGYLRTATDRQTETKILATRWGEYRRDAALLNYNRRYMFDNLMGIISPYQFWATHSMIAWATESLARPGMIASYYRLKKFMATAVTRKGTPSRLAGRVKLSLPWMPEWMGGGVWVDPMKLGLPLETFAQPWEEVASRQSRLNDKIEGALDEMLAAGEISREDYRAARDYIAGASSMDDVSAGLRTASGLGEPSGYSQAKGRVLAADPSLRYDLADFAVQMFPPALLVNMAYQSLRGTPERQGPLPITRDVRNLTAGLGIGGPGGVNLEEGIRRRLDLPVFDEWQDYRIDRELANMAVEGLISPEQAQAAMIERGGPAFEMAQQREAQQGGADLTVQIFGRLFGGAAVFPEGERVGRQMQLLYNAAREAQDNGDTEAISRVLERYPELEARLALGKDPETRLRNFLVDQIWAAYEGLPTLYRRQAVDQFGADFSEMFLQGKAYEDIPPETLAAWARTLGRYVPDNVDGPALDLSLAPEPVAYEVQRFYDERAGTFDMQAIGALMDEYYALGKYDRVGMGEAPESVEQFYTERDRIFPGIGATLGAYGALPKNSEPAAREAAFPGIGGLLDQYYALPKGSGERKAYLNANPVIRQYFDWKDQYKAQHPEDGARAAFREANPQLVAYFDWSDQYKAQHPEAGAYMDSDAPRVRDVYVDNHPELPEYWDWRSGWMDAHPVSAAWIKETAPAQQDDSGQDAGQAEPPAPTRAIVGSDALQGVVSAYLFSARRLPPSARKLLMPAFEAHGRDGQTLDQYLIQVMAGGGVLELDAQGVP